MDWADKTVLERIAICIGAQKAATTYLDRNFRRHPMLDLCIDKEVHYFDACHAPRSPLERRRDHVRKLLENDPSSLQDYQGGVDLEDPEIRRKVENYAYGEIGDSWYCGNFSDSEGRWPVDVTPAYASLSEAAFQHMRRISNDTRILFVLRDPVARIWSQIRSMHQSDRAFRHRRFAGDDLSSKGTEEILEIASRRGVRAATDYVGTLSRLGKVFESDRVMIMFYDEVAADPAAALNRIYAFLGVSEMAEETLSGERENVSTSLPIPGPVAKALTAEYQEMVRTLDREFVRVPESWKWRYGLGGNG